MLAMSSAGSLNHLRLSVRDPAASEAAPTACELSLTTALVRWLNRTMGQPRRLAIRSSLESGLTATGCPTARSIGRSDSESE